MRAGSVTIPPTKELKKLLHPGFELGRAFRKHGINSPCMDGGAENIRRAIVVSD